MHRGLFIAIVSFLFIFICSCDNDVNGGKHEFNGVQKGDTAVRTLLVYMMAENSLGVNFDSLDIKEVAEAAVDVPSDCRLFVFVDDESHPRILQFYNIDGEGANETLHPFADDICSSDTASLGATLRFLLDDYPTRSLDIVLWSHGDGWLPGKHAAPMRSVGIDNGWNGFSNISESVIEMDELATMLENLPVKVSRLMFDACFMQCVEVAYALRNAVEWIIASPAEIPGNGAPYNTVVGAFFASDGVEEILECYKAAYEGEYMGVVLSAAYMPAMQQLADITYAPVCNYFNINKKRDYIDVFAYLPGGVRTASWTMPCFYDANAVMKKYLSASEYAIWSEALSKAVPHLVTTGEWYSSYKGRVLPVDTLSCGGISMYMPQTSSYNVTLNDAFSRTEWYRAAGWEMAGW